MRDTNVVIKQVSHGDEKYSVENIVNNIVIVLVTDGDYTCHSECRVMYRMVGSICHTPETNVTLYANCTLIKKRMEEARPVRRLMQKSRQDRTIAGAEGGGGDREEWMDPERTLEVKPTGLAVVDNEGKGERKIHAWLFCFRNGLDGGAIYLNGKNSKSNRYGGTGARSQDFCSGHVMFAMSFDIYRETCGLLYGFSKP